MIRKKKICKGCYTEQYIFSNGKCRRCIAPTYSSNRKKKRAIKFGGDTALSDFYEGCIKVLSGICECCGQPYTPCTHMGLSVHVAHILPKSLFPEVATHPKNWFEASWMHHTQFDSTYDGLFLNKFEQFIPELRNRFKEFEHLILDEHRRFIPSFLQT